MINLESYEKKMLIITNTTTKGKRVTISIFYKIILLQNWIIKIAFWKVRIKNVRTDRAVFLIMLS